MAGDVMHIWQRLIDPDDDQLDPGTARAIVNLKFKQADVERMNELAALAREGQLKPDEKEEIDGYLHVGHILAMLQSRARQALKRQAIAAAQDHP